VWKDGRRGRRQDGHRERQELNNRMWLDGNKKKHRVGDKRTDFHFGQTTKPTMSEASASVKHSSDWSSYESKKRFSPEISLRFLCEHASWYDCIPFCSRMSQFSGIGVSTWDLVLLWIDDTSAEDRNYHMWLPTAENSFFFILFKGKKKQVQVVPFFRFPLAAPEQTFAWLKHSSLRP
jgi:hypothetical protein